MCPDQSITSHLEPHGCRRHRADGAERAEQRPAAAGQGAEQECGPCTLGAWLSFS